MPQSLWEMYRAGGLAAAQASDAADARSQFYLALLAFGEEAFLAGAIHARRAAALEPASLVYREAATYLDRVAEVGKQGVYVRGEAFAAFIRSGGNVPLYANTSAALRSVYATLERPTLLDIGVGDGLALLPALVPSIARVDLVEPSTAMLVHTCAALDERGVPYRSFPQYVQEFALTSADRWDLAQATFSLQSLPPTERRSTLNWLRRAVGRLLLAEFDVPDLGELYNPARVAHMVERYEWGLAEYPEAGGLVAQGFLMPVFFGAFDRSVARTNYEQPIAAWEDDLRAAGFSHVARRPLYDYWWATAYLVDAAA